MHMSRRHLLPGLKLQVAKKLSVYNEIHSLRTGSETLDFENHKEAFKMKSNWELYRSLGILKLCGINAFTENSLKIQRMAQAVLRKKLFEKIMKATFYGQFVAGDCEKDIGKTITELWGRGMRSMIACPNEEDVGESSDSEEKYKRCFQRAVECIRLAAIFSHDLPKVQIKLTGKLQVDILLPDSISEKFNENELGQLERGLQRISKVGQCAVNNNVTLLVDAEYTYVNPAISILTLAMMITFNEQRANVWNTYQCYLKDALDCIQNDLEIANELGVHNFGAKIVRGAYIARERELAHKNNYPDPINDSLEATAIMYNKVGEFMLKYMKNYNEKCKIVIATHNEDAVRFLATRMKQLGFQNNDQRVCFGQLYGMCDQISYALAQKDYVVYKSMPYGSVDDVIPYLYRRAMENRDVLKGSRKEVELLKKELKYRLKNISRIKGANW